MKRIVVNLMFCIFCTLTFAQEVMLIRKNEDIQKKVSQKVAEKYSKKDPEKQAVYKDVIRTAFDEYMNDSKVKVKFTESNYNSLKEEITHLNDSIEKLNTLYGDINSLNAKINKLEVDAERESNEKFESKLDSLNESIHLKDSLIKDYGILIEKLQKGSLEMASRMGEMKSEAENNNSILVLFGRMKDKIESVRNDIDNLYSVSKNQQLLEISIEKIKLSIDAYKSYYPIIVEANQQLCDELNKKTDELSTLSELCILMKNGKNQMANEKFDNVKNSEMANQLARKQEEVSKMLSDVQEKECSEMIGLLKRQQYSYLNLKSILNDISNLKCLPYDKAVENALGIIKSNLAAFNGGDKYNEYYEVFNKILDDLRKDLKNENVYNNFGKTEQLADYLNGMLSRL